jgi:hypothetical protein
MSSRSSRKSLANENANEKEEKMFMNSQTDESARTLHPRVSQRLHATDSLSAGAALS